MIAIVVLTHNRLDLLRKCVEQVLFRTSVRTREIVIWNNASTDGTEEYLATITDPRVRVVNHTENIGQNGYARAFALTREPYMIEVDDDVTDAPLGWDATLLNAFVRLPNIGFLAANLVDDPKDEASYLMHHQRARDYARIEQDGVPLLKGPVGGGCTITSRELHDRIGGFRQSDDQVFWLEDAAYIEDISKLGYEAAFLEDLHVHHTGGAYYASQSREKIRYWEQQRRRNVRRARVKQVLLAVPFVARLNARHSWFAPPPRGPSASMSRKQAAADTSPSS